jgi:hypothetical protein
MACKLAAMTQTITADRTGLGAQQRVSQLIAFART